MVFILFGKQKAIIDQLEREYVRATQGEILKTLKALVYSKFFQNNLSQNYLYLGSTTFY
jgi:hypothetical protein